MSTVMNEQEMRALAAELAKNIKTEKDLNDFSKQLKKMTVEAALGAEMEERTQTRLPCEQFNKYQILSTSYQLSCDLI